MNKFITNRSVFLFLFLIAAALISVSSCKKKDKAKESKPAIVVPILSAVATTKDIPVELQAIGAAEAYTTISVKSRIGGYLQEVHFKEGDEVKAGDPLFTIDPRPYQAALKQAKAVLAKDSAQLQNARLTASRYESLAKEGFASQQDSDLTRTNARAAANVVAADKAAVEKANLDLSYCYIHSPISGRTGSILIQNGNLVNANDTKAMVVVTQFKPIYVNFAVPAQYLSEIRKRKEEGTLAIEASVPRSDTPPVTGEITFIDNTVDSATGTIRMKATFDNDENALWPGQFVNVTIKLYVISEAVVVPSQAVMSGQKGQFVYIVKGDATVEMRDVTSEYELNGDSVIESGLSSGEKVVTDGQLRLAAGSKVSIKNQEINSSQGK